MRSFRGPGRTAPVGRDARPTGRLEDVRLVAPAEAIGGMRRGLAADPLVAAILADPRYAGQAGAIAARAARWAVQLHEAEGGRRPLDDVLAHELGRARQEILALPELYDDQGPLARAWERIKALVA